MDSYRRAPQSAESMHDFSALSAATCGG